MRPKSFPHAVERTREDAQYLQQSQVDCILCFVGLESGLILVSFNEDPELGLAPSRLHGALASKDPNKAPCVRGFATEPWHQPEYK